MSARIIVGDCRVSMSQMETASVDSIVCDPPYHLTSIVERFGKEDAAPAKSNGATGVYARASRGFMGQTWDGGDIAFRPETWRQALRVLKPGGYLLAFSATRTYHRMTCAIEDAGFEIRDCIGWHYGSGFPKSLDVSKAIDRAAGAEREVLSSKPAYGIGGNGCFGGHADGAVASVTLPATDAARQWSGWGTALKPAWEPIVVARKPLEGTVAGNVLKYGTGAMNIDGCRVPHGSDVPTGSGGRRASRVPGDERTDTGAGLYGRMEGAGYEADAQGRWPANVILSHGPDCGEDGCAPGCPCAAMDAQSLAAGMHGAGQAATQASRSMFFGDKQGATKGTRFGDTGGASRFFSNLRIEADDLVPFFYAAKASRREREAGCDDMPARSGAEAVQREEGSAGTKSPGAGAGRTAASVRNNHPTVKPVSVMAWCIRLVTPPGGLVLDPFTGSGKTGVAARREGMRFVGCELSEEYAEIARARIAHANGPLFTGGE